MAEVYLEPLPPPPFFLYHNLVLPSWNHIGSSRLHECLYMKLNSVAEVIQSNPVVRANLELSLYTLTRCVYFAYTWDLKRP